MTDTTRVPPPECCGEGSDGVHDSLLEFNAHVLALAAAPGTPPLERARFLAIMTHNLDEFFTVRVAELKLRVADENDAAQSPFDWPDPTVHIDIERATAAADRAAALVDEARTYLRERVKPELAREGIRLARWSELTDAARASASAYFDTHVAPAIPSLVLGGPVVPHLWSLCRALVLAPAGGRPGQLAVVPVPRALPRFVDLDGIYITIEELIRAHVGTAAEPVVAYEMRVTRAADERSRVTHDGDWVRTAEALVARRELAPVVRLEVDAAMPQSLRAGLVGYFRGESPAARALGDAEVHEIDPPPTSLDALDEIAGLPRPELSYPGFPRRDPLGGAPLFETVAAGDVVAHYPYDDFDAVTLRLLAEAAVDPAVRRIQITIYRTDGHSPVIAALVRARAAGKDVVVLIELMARFDEIRNLHFTRVLEAAGCTVVHAPPDLKVHAKVILIDRDDRPYGYVSTGNFNAFTGRLYTDFAMLSARPEFCGELRRLFDHLRAGEVGEGYTHLLVSPYEMRDRFLALIADQAALGAAGRIRAKLNGLDDPEMIAALYAASDAGVRIELVVRGLCTLRPGVAGLSERIRVVSLVGRFLEHGRIYAFGDGDATAYWIGSADWRARNLTRRVEVAAPVVDRAACARLEWTLQSELADPTAWVLRPDGSYVTAIEAGAPAGPSTQERIIKSLLL